MSVSESDSSPPESEPRDFVEDDHEETLMPMGTARVPIYVALLWVGFIAAYVIVMSMLALPDLRAWLSH
jgi:hypothetical protein